MEQKQEIMKLGLDIHGVIDALPEFFGPLTKTLVKAGWEVHILTGIHWSEDIENELKTYGVVWTHHLSIADHHRSIGTPMTYKRENNPVIDELLWDKTKGEYCKEHEIDFHIDDTLAYEEHFMTPFCRLYSNNNKPKKNKSEKYIK